MAGLVLGFFGRGFVCFFCLLGFGWVLLVGWVCFVVLGFFCFGLVLIVTQARDPKLS